MEKADIISLLYDRHEDFVDYMGSLSESEFNYALKGKKWTAGQEMVHIIKSVNMLSNALLLPKFVVKIKFGKANRPSRTYDAVVEKYHTKLDEFGGAYQVELKPVRVNKRDALSARLLISVGTLCRRVGRYSENALDKYILPHPLMGKMTIRELLYFTAYHVKHHRGNSVRNLSEKSDAPML